MKEIEFLTVPFEVKKVKDDQNIGLIEGYASTFGNVDLGLDVVDKGAFKKTIKEGGVKWPILADHNPLTPIGINVEANEDSKGLEVVGELELGVEKAKERYLLAKQAQRHGGRMGLSIGYMTITAAPNKDNPRIRHLKEIKMYEYSLVTFPMNTEAMVTAAKSIGAIDKANFLLQHLKNQGIDLKDLEVALRMEAAKHDEDPSKLAQSLDTLIEKFKS